MMEYLYIADKTVEELFEMFSCEIDDDDYYDVIAYNISKKDINVIIEKLSEFHGPRLRAAIFALGVVHTEHDLSAILSPYFEDSEPLVIARVIDAFRHKEYLKHLARINKLFKHNSEFVRSALCDI